MEARRNAPQVPKVDAPPAGDANRSPGRGGRRDPRTYRLRRGDDPVRARRRRHPWRRRRDGAGDRGTRARAEERSDRTSRRSANGGRDAMRWTSFQSSHRKTVRAVELALRVAPTRGVRPRSLDVVVALVVVRDDGRDGVCRPPRPRPPRGVRRRRGDAVAHDGGARWCGPRASLPPLAARAPSKCRARE